MKLTDLGPATAVAPSRAPSRYERIMDSSPRLVDQLRQAEEQDALSLRDEIAAARVTLGESLRILARVEAKNGVIDPAAVVLLSDQLKTVRELIRDEAGIRARNKEIGLDAAKVMLLVGALRDDLRRTLAGAGQAAALPFIEAVFERAKWPDQVDERTVQEALEAPAEYEVAFRVIERDERTGKVLESSRVGRVEDVAPKSTQEAETQRLLDELEQTEAEMAEEPTGDVVFPPPSGNGNGNGHAKEDE